MTGLESPNFKVEVETKELHRFALPMSALGSFSRALRHSDLAVCFQHVHCKENKTQMA